MSEPRIFLEYIYSALCLLDDVSATHVCERKLLTHEEGDAFMLQQTDLAFSCIA